MLLQYGSKSSSSECLNNIATWAGMTMDLNEKMFCSALAVQKPLWPCVQEQLRLMENQQQKRSEATKQVPHKHFSTHGLPASSNLSSCIVTWSPLYLLFSSSLYHLNYFLYITGLNAYFSVLWVRTSFHLGWKWGVFCTASALANAPARLLRGMGGPHGERKSQAAASWLSCSGSFRAFLLNSAS